MKRESKAIWGNYLKNNTTNSYRFGKKNEVDKEFEPSEKVFESPKAKSNSRGPSGLLAYK